MIKRPDRAPHRSITSYRGGDIAGAERRTHSIASAAKDTAFGRNGGRSFGQVVGSWTSGTANEKTGGPPK
jgi:hypothetical protein